MHDPPPTPGRAVVAGALLALAGCSLIYDPGKFSSTDGGVDARPPDATILDADLENLTLTDAVVFDLHEGSGCIFDGTVCTEAARAIPIVVRGSNIDPSATVTIDGAIFSDLVVPAVFSADHNMLALAVRIPPDLGIADDASETLTIRVVQGASADQMLDVTIDGLDDFLASVDAPGGMLDVTAAPLDPLYATVNIDASIRFTGDIPVRLRASSAFTLGANLDVSGFNGVNGTRGAGGPGGCRGGDTVGPADCTDGGGKAGGENSGGGGGGHGIAGTTGNGPNGGMPGDEVGDESLAPLSATESRGNGGGGGGDGLVAGVGGTGGGGGGTVVITSEGTVAVGDTASIISNGGDGSSGTGACVLDNHGGGGGGGSGGAVLIRARTSFSDAGSTTRVSVNAGAGGDAGSGAGCNDGGPGAPGRVRIDLPSIDADPSLVGASAWRGPVIDPVLPPIVTTADVEVGVFGGPNEEYRIQVEGTSAQPISVPPGRRGTAMVTLSPGHNRVCVLVNENVNASVDEGAQCVNIAYMPPQ